eukprot:s386_g40.t1
MVSDQAEAEVRAACKKGPVEAVQPAEEALRALGVGLGPKGSKVGQVPQKSKHDEATSEHNHPTRKGSCVLVKVKFSLLRLFMVSNTLWFNSCFPQLFCPRWLESSAGRAATGVSRVRAEFSVLAGDMPWRNQGKKYQLKKKDWEDAEEDEDSPRGADSGEAAELSGGDTDSSSDIEVGKPIPSAPSGINVPKEEPASPKAKEKVILIRLPLVRRQTAPKAAELVEASPVPKAKAVPEPKEPAEPFERAVVKPPAGKPARKSASKPKAAQKPAVSGDAVQNPKRVSKVHGRALKLNREIIKLAEEWDPCKGWTMESPFQVRSIAAKRLVQKRGLRGSIAQQEVRKMFRLPNQDGTGDIEQACSSCDERSKGQAGPVVEYIRRHGLRGSGPRTRPSAGPVLTAPRRSRKLNILKSSTLKRKERRAAEEVPAPPADEEEVDFGSFPSKEES